MMTSWLARAGLLLAAALASSGCARVVDLAPAAPSAAAVDEPPAPSALELELERRLARVEQALPEVAEQERAELEAERLALLVVLTALPSSAGGEADEADPLVAAARVAVDRAREDASEEAKEDQTLALAKLLREEQKNLEQQRSRAEEERSRVRRQIAAEDKSKETVKAGAKKSQGCSPGDPLCSDFDGDDGIDLPPSETPITAWPRDGRDEPSQGQVGAARVAYEPPPTGVMAEIRRHFGRVSACIPPALRQQELQLRVVVLLDERGLLRQPRVEGSELDAVTRECVADIFRTMRVEDPPGSSRVLNVPLWLAAER